MGDLSQFTTSIVTVLTAVIGLAIIAVLVSNQANTAQVVQAGSQGFSSILATAVSPVSGNSFTGGGVGYNSIP